jgi:hypothetical protein
VEPAGSDPDYVENINSDATAELSGSEQTDAQDDDMDALQVAKRRGGRAVPVVHSPLPIPSKPSGPNAGQKRSADRISTSRDLKSKKSLLKQVALPMPPSRDPTIPVPRRGARLTSSFLNPHPEADDYLHRHEAEEAKRKKADPPRTAGQSTVPPHASPRRGARERTKTQKKKLFEESKRASGTKTIFEGEQPAKRRRVLKSTTT